MKYCGSLGLHIFTVCWIYYSNKTAAVGKVTHTAINWSVHAREIKDYVGSQRQNYPPLVSISVIIVTTGNLRSTMQTLNRQQTQFLGNWFYVCINPPSPCMQGALALSIENTEDCADPTQSPHLTTNSSSTNKN
jgi:hypothetical protein